MISFYDVVHRFAAPSGPRRWRHDVDRRWSTGVTFRCADTHRDNKPMQGLLASRGFPYQASSVSRNGDEYRFTACAA